MEPKPPTGPYPDDFLLGHEALEATLDAIDLTGLDHCEIGEAFDGFFSNCDRSIQEVLLGVLTNVMGIDNPKRIPVLLDDDEDETVIDQEALEAALEDGLLPEHYPAA